MIVVEMGVWVSWETGTTPTPWGVSAQVWVPASDPTLATHHAAYEAAEASLFQDRSSVVSLAPVTSRPDGALKAQMTPGVPVEHVLPHELTVRTKHSYEAADKPVTAPGDDETPEPPVPTGVLEHEPPSATQK